MKILLVGAGIASLTLAYWLRQFGYQASIIEKAPSIRTEGYILDFAGTGWDVANRMGLIPALHTVEQGMDGLIYRTQKRAVPIRMNDLFKAAEGEVKYMALNRRDLVRVLYEAVKEDVDVRFDTHISDISQSHESVSVSLSDGSKEDYEFVVGGDGIHSQVRRLVFGEEAAFSHYLGYQFALFTIPAIKEFNDKFFQLYLAPGKQLGVYPMSSDEWLIYLVYHNTDSIIPAPAERASFLQERFQAVGWLVPEIMRTLSSETYIYLDNVCQIQMPTWTNQRVALIGDAAYCPTLISGQGASMAMAGGYYLAQELHQHKDYQVAFAAYQSDLRQNIEIIQKKARNFAPNFVPQKQWQITLISWMMQMISLPFVRGMVGKQFSIESILDAS